MIKVLIADDSAIMRRALTQFLTRQPEIMLLGQIEEAEQLVTLTNKLRPDVIILDVRMVENCVASLPLIRAALQGTKVLAITLGADDMPTQELAEQLNPEKLIDKMKLADELIPALLEMAPAGSPSPPACLRD